MPVDKAAERDPPPDVDKDHHEFFTQSGKGVVMNWHSYHENGPNKRRRKGISASCQVHRGPVGFANLVVSMQEGWIVFDPHVTGACVMALDEEGARILLYVLTEWLG